VIDAAVIFDVDGVLVDSYRAHLQSWLELARECKTVFTETDFAVTFGQTSREIIGRFWGGWLDDEQVRRLDDRKEAIFRRIISQRFPAMDGAVGLIDALRDAGWRLALGSSGPPENIELILEKLGRRSCFDAVVTGRDVTRGKPDPQVFLIAARRLQVAPARCVVIEDAPAGIEAAGRAGMKAVALRSTGRAEADFGKADRVVDSLRDLSPHVLQGLIDRP
jgi:beta-phosphoglucomutase